MNRYKRHLAGFRPQVQTPSKTLKIVPNKNGELLLKRGNKYVVAGPFVKLSEAYATLLVMALRS